MSNNTPGPWKFLKSGMLVTADERKIIGHFHLARGNKCDDARLIAASAALLEALKTVLLAHKYDGALTTGTARLSRAIESMIERAIAEAEGQ